MYIYIYYHTSIHSYMDAYIHTSRYAMEHCRKLWDLAKMHILVHIHIYLHKQI